MVVSACALPGCGAVERCVSSRESGGHKSNQPVLRVVHVASERGVYAGTPVDTYHILTIMSWADSGLSAIVADGFTAVWETLHGEPAIPDGRRALGFPAVGLFASCKPLDFVPNSLDICTEVSVDQRVSIGGFHCEKALPEYWLTPASVVIGRISHISRGPDPISGGMKAINYHLSVPAGDYQGFLGGPVGLERTGEGIQVIAVVIGQQTMRAEDGKRESVLLARPISEILMSAQR